MRMWVVHRADRRAARATRTAGTLARLASALAVALSMTGCPAVLSDDFSIASDGGGLSDAAMPLDMDGGVDAHSSDAAVPLDAHDSAPAFTAACCCAAVGLDAGRCDLESWTCDADGGPQPSQNGNWTWGPGPDAGAWTEACDAATPASVGDRCSIGGEIGWGIVEPCP
jgi:hypothetical protein